jgi:prephenate dehydrogenase
MKTKSSQIFAVLREYLLMCGKPLSSKGTYIGAHPMTGKEKSGYENSDAFTYLRILYLLSAQKMAKVS